MLRAAVLFALVSSAVVAAAPVPKPSETPVRCVWVDTWFPGGGAGSQLKNPEPGKSTHLRITRKDKVVNVSYSFDGKEWSPPYNPRQAMEFPDEVAVGVFFAHSTYQLL